MCNICLNLSTLVIKATFSFFLNSAQGISNLLFCNDNHNSKTKNHHMSQKSLICFCGLFLDSRSRLNKTAKKLSLYTFWSMQVDKDCLKKLIIKRFYKQSKGFIGLNNALFTLYLCDTLQLLNVLRPTHLLTQIFCKPCLSTHVAQLRAMQETLLLTFSWKLF